MITINPPVVAPYAPSSMPIASASVSAFISPDIGVVALQVRLFTAKGASVPVNRADIPALDAAGKTAFLTSLDAGGGVENALLAYLSSAYGLVGTVS
jgi:hypothetical protein